jgi:hypothetical protein
MPSFHEGMIERAESIRRQKQDPFITLHESEENYTGSLTVDLRI